MNIRATGRRGARRLTAVLAGLGILGAGAVGTVIVTDAASSNTASGTTSASTSTSTSVQSGTGSSSSATSTGS